MTNYLPPSIAKYHGLESIDPSTFSNYTEFDIKETFLDWTVLFDKQIICGSVTYTLKEKFGDQKNANKRTKRVVQSVHLDTSYLDISKIEVNGTQVLENECDGWYLKERCGDLGSELVIQSDVISDCLIKGEEFVVKVHYATTQKCTALQWLNGEQSGDTPYVFAQLEPIHARSLFPCFDTPGSKSVYKAVIKSEQPVCFSGLPIMSETNTSAANKSAANKSAANTSAANTSAANTSAANTSVASINEVNINDLKTSNSIESATSCTKLSSSFKEYCFVQKWPIPTYLLVIASGNIQTHSIGPRSSVYAQPHFLQNAINQFTPDMEKMIQAAEDILYTYPNEDYSIAIMPTSYPFGGCECMNCTILSPSILNSKFKNMDQSVTTTTKSQNETTEFNSTLAHELMHTYSGNLVTNSTWEHMWLNEGTCVLLERKVLAHLFQDERVRGFESLNGWNDLQNSIDNMDNPQRFSSLVHDYSDKINPDLGFSTVFYEKGAALHYTLEQLVGGAQHYDQFLKHYFRTFAFQSINTWQFLDCLYEFFYHYDKTKYKVLYDEMDWNTWLFQPGMPPKPKFDASLCEKVYNLTAKWVKCATTGGDPHKFFSSNDIEHFSVGQMILFLDALTNDKEYGMKNWFEFSNLVQVFFSLYDYKFQELKGYAETDFRLFKFKIHAHIKEAYKELSAWLGTIGRMKFVRPSYVLLKSVDKPLAIATFKKYKHTYHPICYSMVKQDLGL
ncbi:hypothetical protein ACO0RG_001201 [Hanseniaspora osmophila]